MLRLTLLLLFGLIFFASALDDSTESSEESTESGNDTVPQDLYVIKTVVYEVGILTDAGNQTDLNNDTLEQVDVSFYDPKSNGSSFDLSNIPIPIETNVSGVSVTGILPVNLGSIILPPNGAAAQLNTTFPLLPDKQLKVTHNISTFNPEKSSQILSNLSGILGLGAKQNRNTTQNNEN